MSTSAILILLLVGIILAIFIARSHADGNKEKTNVSSQRPSTSNGVNNMQGKDDSLISDTIIARIQSITDQHIKTLFLKWRQTTYQDEYGNTCLDKWNIEYGYFVDNVISKDELLASWLVLFDKKSKIEFLKACATIIYDSISNYSIKQSECILSNEVIDQIHSITDQHIKTLALKWDQTVYKGEFGEYVYDKWHQAVNYFVDNVIRKDKIVADYLIDSTREQAFLDGCYKIIHDSISEYKATQLVGMESIDVDSLNPIQFEHYCADILRNNGWTVRVTQASGDQGIDLIASYGDVKAVFQCKQYSQPVGNGGCCQLFCVKYS